MGKVANAETAGSIVARVRKDLGMSRAALSAATGVAPRTIYAFEQGESKNFGLENYLKLLRALGLRMSVEPDESSPHAFVQTGNESPIIPELELSDAWKLDGKDGR